LDPNSDGVLHRPKNASSLPSSVIGEILDDTSSELSEPGPIAQVSSSKITAHLAIAPALHLRTVEEMTNQGLALKHHTDALVTNIRGLKLRATSTAPERVATTLAKILPISAPAPLLQFPPTTRAIGSSGRIRVTINNQSLGELLGWATGPLTVALNGPWVILSSEPSEKARRRNDGYCTYTQDERLRLSGAICKYLGTPVGDEVALLLLPEHGALALVNPARLLLGAPLNLLDPLGQSKAGGI
jgi:hypothetical protein